MSRLTSFIVLFLNIGAVQLGGRRNLEIRFKHIPAFFVKAGFVVNEAMTTIVNSMSYLVCPQIVSFFTDSENIFLVFVFLDDCKIFSFRMSGVDSADIPAIKTMRSVCHSNPTKDA